MPPVPAERCLPVREVFEPRFVRRVDGPPLIGYGCTVEGVASLVLCELTADGAWRDTQRRAVDPPLRAARPGGGGVWCPSPDGSSIVYLASVDGRHGIWHESVDATGARCVVLAPEGVALAAPSPSPDGTEVVCTADHVDTTEVWVVGLGDGRVRRVDDGRHSFCLDPAFEADGSVIWIGWNEPDMPWDHAVLVRARNDALPEVIHAPSGAVQQPRSGPHGAWFAVCDDGGHLNVWRNGAPLVVDDVEHAGPSWGPGQRSFAVEADGRSVAFTRNEGGFGRLCRAVLTDTAVSDGSAEVVRVDEVGRGVHTQLDHVDDQIVAVRSGARTPTQVVHYDLRHVPARRQVLAAMWDDGDWSDADLVEPSLVEIPVEAGVIGARLYTAEPDRVDPGRLIVWIHGGPTDQWQVTFMPRIAFWRSRGWHVLVPDHRGSTGHGRVVQQALRGRWGELDVADTTAAIRWAQRRGLATPAATVLMGASAGGFTVLGALGADPSAVAAAVVACPVSDLVDLATHSHRFERHYTDTLVGPLPAAAAVLRARSPIAHVDRLARRPILVLHGDADPVVPVHQTRRLVERLRAAGGHVETHEYPGEGHGWRRREHQLDEYRRVGDFLGRVVPIASTG